MANVITTGADSRRIEKEINKRIERIERIEKELKIGALKVYFCGACKMEIKTVPFFIEENDICPYCHAPLGENIKIYSLH